MACRIIYPNHDLSSFLELIEENYIKFKRPKDEVEDICRAVEELVENILNEMGKHEPRFGNLKDKLLKVGSFYSGTKISEPDEFDYLVVLDELPIDQAQLREICSLFPGFRHVFLLKGNKIAVKWKDYTNEDNFLINRGREGLKRVKEIGDWFGEGRLRRTQLGEGVIPYEEGIRGRFHTYLNESFHATKRLSRISKLTGYLDLSSYDKRFEFSADGNEYYLKAQRTEIQIHGPATNIVVRWIPKREPTEVLTLTVDISPAFRSSDIEGAIRLDCIEHETVRKAVLEQGNFLIVPTAYRCVRNGLCFNIAHTETELKIINKLSDVHKRSYRLLKYIMNGNNRISRYEPKKQNQLEAFYFIHDYCGMQAFECFSSFVLKVLIIKHSFACTCKDGSSPDACVKDVLFRIRNEIVKALLNTMSYVNIPLTNIFDLRQRIISQKVIRHILETNLMALDDVLQILREGPYALDHLLPVNIGSLLRYIDSIDFASRDWKKHVRDTLTRAKPYEVHTLPDVAD